MRAHRCVAARPGPLCSWDVVTVLCCWLRNAHTCARTQPGAHARPRRPLLLPHDDRTAGESPAHCRSGRERKEREPLAAAQVMEPPRRKGMHRQPWLGHCKVHGRRPGAAQRRANFRPYGGVEPAHCQDNCGGGLGVLVT